MSRDRIVELAALTLLVVLIAAFYAGVLTVAAFHDEAGCAFYSDRNRLCRSR
jgi:hypothetical protein